MSRIRLVDVLFGGALALLGVGQEQLGNTAPKEPVALEVSEPLPETDPEESGTERSSLGRVPLLFAEPQFLR